ncbi:MAG: hypothetical protein U0Q18_11250 [Bryobacteraceae bacterium]
MAAERTSGQGPLLSSLAALLSVLAALSCCLPLAPFLLAAGIAGASGVFLSLQPYLVGLAILMLVFGFVQTFRARQCTRKRRVLNTIVLLCSVSLISLIMLSLVPAAAPGGQPALARLQLQDFRQAFNGAADETRVVALFSPT